MKGDHLSIYLKNLISAGCTLGLGALGRIGTGGHVQLCEIVSLRPMMATVPKLQLWKNLKDKDIVLHALVLSESLGWIIMLLLLDLLEEDI